jgi:Tfp pilus assembly protein PilO
MKSIRTLSMLTGLAVLGVLAAGYMLLISPKRAEVKDLNAQAASQQQANKATRGRIDTLTEQAKNLPKKQAELATLAEQLPNNPALPALIRSLTSAADRDNVELVALLPQAPAEQADPAAPIRAAASGTAASAGAAGSAAKPAAPATGAAAAPKPAAPSETLMGIPVQIVLRGKYFNIENFLASLESQKRALVVGQLVIQPDTDRAGGNPAGKRAPDVLQATVAARVFMIQPKVVTTTATTAGASSSAAK